MKLRPKNEENKEWWLERKPLVLPHIPTPDGSHTVRVLVREPGWAKLLSKGSNGVDEFFYCGIPEQTVKAKNFFVSFSIIRPPRLDEPLSDEGYSAEVLGDQPRPLPARDCPSR